MTGAFSGIMASQIERLDVSRDTGLWPVLAVRAWDRGPCHDQNLAVFGVVWSILPDSVWMSDGLENLSLTIEDWFSL